MEFKFNINDVFKTPIVEVTHNLIPPGYTGDRRALWDAVSKVGEVVNTMGAASATAQGLSKAITTADRMRNSEHKLYFLIDPTANNNKGAVTGMLKTGSKSLYVFDRDGNHYQVKPPCLLDFYVHESRQRNGLGKVLFEHMLQKENIEPVQMAIDRPSDKLLGFLNKHYCLKNPVKQMNNYVVFDDFFPKRSLPPPVPQTQPEGVRSKYPPPPNSANGLQTAPTPMGRYGAPRPPCSMGQIIHNQSPTEQRQEVTGAQSMPTTNYQGYQQMYSPQNTAYITQSTPNMYYGSQQTQIDQNNFNQYQGQMPINYQNVTGQNWQEQPAMTAQSYGAVGQSFPGTTSAYQLQNQNAAQNMAYQNQNTGQYTAADQHYPMEQTTTYSESYQPRAIQRVQPAQINVNSYSQQSIDPNVANVAAQQLADNTAATQQATNMIAQQVANLDSQQPANAAAQAYVQQNVMSQQQAADLAPYTQATDQQAIDMVASEKLAVQQNADIAAQQQAQNIAAQQQAQNMAAQQHAQNVTSQQQLQNIAAQQQAQNIDPQQQAQNMAAQQQAQNMAAQQQAQNMAAQQQAQNMAAQQQAQNIAAQQQAQNIAAQQAQNMAALQQAQQQAAVMAAQQAAQQQAIAMAPREQTTGEQVAKITAQVPVPNMTAQQQAGTNMSSLQQAAANMTAQQQAAANSAAQQQASANMQYDAQAALNMIAQQQAASNMAAQQQQAAANMAAQQQQETANMAEQVAFLAAQQQAANIAAQQQAANIAAQQQAANIAAHQANMVAQQQAANYAAQQLAFMAAQQRVPNLVGNGMDSVTKMTPHQIPSQVSQPMHPQYATIMPSVTAQAGYHPIQGVHSAPVQPISPMRQIGAVSQSVPSIMPNAIQSGVSFSDMNQNIPQIMNSPQNFNLASGDHSRRVMSAGAVPHYASPVASKQEIAPNFQYQMPNNLQSYQTQIPSDKMQAGTNPNLLINQYPGGSQGDFAQPNYNQNQIQMQKNNQVMKQVERPASAEVCGADRFRVVDRSIKKNDGRDYVNDVQKQPQQPSTTKLERPRSLIIQHEAPTEVKEVTKHDIENEEDEADKDSLADSIDVGVEELDLEEMVKEKVKVRGATENFLCAGSKTPSPRKTPSHLTEQGYFDLKFYHNKLW